jgi:hypothetical protein
VSCKITIEVSDGTSIERACEDACRVANRLNIDVEFVFNSVRCLARPDGSSAELANNWDRELRRELRSPYDRRFAMTDATSAGKFLLTPTPERKSDE